MNIVTTRFGPLQVHRDDLVVIPEGLVGFRNHTQFVLWSDPEAPSITWLQSTTDPALAFALVSPVLVAGDYKVELRPGDRSALELDDRTEPRVYVILNRGDHGLTVNLQGPLIFNPASRLARQLVLTSSRYAVRYPLDVQAAPSSVNMPQGGLRATA